MPSAEGGCCFCRQVILASHLVIVTLLNLEYSVLVCLLENSSVVILNMFLSSLTWLVKNRRSGLSNCDLFSVSAKLQLV